jgi:hypothetical protein
MVPAILTSHVGYLPGMRKAAIVTDKHQAGAPFVGRRCDQYPPEGTPIVLRGTLSPFSCEWGDFSVADMSALDQRGFFQVAVGEFDRGVHVSEPNCSFPFLIADDVYVKTLRMSFDYFTHQRCGAAVPGYHPICHLDDGIFRDTGVYRDTSGGWHDAGDVRKWLHHTQMYIYSLLELQERLTPDWRCFGRQWSDVLDEARWGNDYQLKMMDEKTGEVFHDVAGGIGGDNCDCRWTDNEPHSGDERHITRVSGSGAIHQWWFVATQAKMSNAFAAIDPTYARTCLHAGFLALKRAPVEPTGKLRDDAIGVLAFSELHRATGEDRYLARATGFAETILKCQATSHEHGQTRVRGYLYSGVDRARFHKETSWPGLPLYALSLLAVRLRGSSEGQRFSDAVKLMVREYLAPMTALNPFGIVPFGLYSTVLAGKGKAHHLAGSLSYRYFNWREASSPENACNEDETFQHGLTSNQLGYAAALMMAERVIGDGVARGIALRQLEWVMGANTHAACLMTGGGVNTPYPYAPFVGIIPGGYAERVHRQCRGCAFHPPGQYG